MSANAPLIPAFSARQSLAAPIALAALIAIAPQTSSAQSAIAPPQSTAPQAAAWQTAAGGHMEFEVASIRRSEPGTFLRPNMVLNAEDTPVPTGGTFVANFSLLIFIEFAWNLMPTREAGERHGRAFARGGFRPITSSFERNSAAIPRRIKSG